MRGSFEQNGGDPFFASQMVRPFGAAQGMLHCASLTMTKRSGPDLVTATSCLDSASPSAALPAPNDGRSLFGTG